MTASRRSGVALSGVGSQEGRHRDGVRAGRVVLGALVNPGYVADEPDGAGGVQVVATDVAVALQRGQDVVDEAGGDPVIAGHEQFFR
jgi:hypothetical protein